MQYELILTGKFEKSLKLAKKRGLDLKLLDKIVTMLQKDIPLGEKHRDHELKGKYSKIFCILFIRSPIYHNHVSFLKIRMIVLKLSYYICSIARLYRKIHLCQ